VSLSTGLAGSITTFSSWQAAAMEAAVDFSFLAPSSPAGQVRDRTGQRAAASPGA